MEKQTRVAVVSGGSSGIGRALVAELHREGWLVHTCGRDTGKLAQLERDFTGVRTAVCDVSDRSAVRHFAEKVFTETPAINLVVSNAGGLREIDFTAADLSKVDLTAELRINAEGAINLVAEFLPGLKRSSGASILVVSSGYALAPATRAPIYSASKAALHSFCIALRRQLAPLNIGVTELLPPVVDTPAVAHRKVSKLSASDVAHQALAGTASRRAEVLPGQARLLPLLLRLAPGLAQRIVAKT